MPGDGGNQPAGHGVVMIPDDSGDLHPWSIIPRPASMTEMSKLADAMELPKDVEESDSPQEIAQKKANEAMFRMIWNKVKLFFQHAIPPTIKGRPPQWLDISSTTRAMVHQLVSEAEPHMRRFEGGWATEEIMKRILRNSRDTASRREKNAQSFKGRKPYSASDRKNRPGQSSLSGSRAAAATKAQQKTKLLAQKQSSQTTNHREHATAMAIEEPGHVDHGEASAEESDTELLQLALQMLKENRGDLKARAGRVVDKDRRMVTQSFQSNDEGFEQDATHLVTNNSKKRKSTGNPKQGTQKLDQSAKSKSAGKTASPEESWEDSVAAELAALITTTKSTKSSKTGGTNGTTAPKKRPKMRPPPRSSPEIAQPVPSSSGLTWEQKQELIENVEGGQGTSSDSVATRKTRSRGKR